MMGPEEGGGCWGWGTQRAPTSRQGTMESVGAGPRPQTGLELSFSSASH